MYGLAGLGLPPWIYGVKSSLVFCPFLTLTELLSFRNTEERINGSEIVTPFFPLGLFMIMMLALLRKIVPIKKFFVQVGNKYGKIHFMYFSSWLVAIERNQA